ncbi:hypothetical protein A3C23_01800 [Candidatus Roizmanbacteria bacterium RIFCSPHIGHO2_02_FULL_37_13b]|uniref:dTDP-4-dehydrorhamnose 3,5-epimerase n=1 Tax=Candidatus Roizmanbacteria bacterium RIFCSPLOWO2_02_FULL_36_11 TaxID=1802071 RepID=A0A1F7JCX5_9BACT|nr:MAG: hypothetical protein A3C23_01800 [Candidatus Roizmanbacteria bacterium RIFCSPHIGHO2_02_FULL_37_13b]OGK53469.1 MAG: hypothetical protein A3H78_02960 [Candidatus Roizmanbacteria bacterium RIFCSPLOWO2_02_FULL_36_11]
MKITEVKTLLFPEVKVIKYGRFSDDRGYFTETFRKSDININTDTYFLKKNDFVQVNESFSKTGTIRGLHFQWNPYLAKLIRTVSGHMVDLVVDIRKGSPNFGKIIAYDMPQSPGDNIGQWIWVPVGFAHGNFFIKDTTIEYFCTSEYSPKSEAGISPLSSDIDWSICDETLRRQFQELIKNKPLISEKDKAGLTLESWKKDPRSQNFIY